MKDNLPCKECCGCGACSSSCPVACITMKKDPQTESLYPIIAQEHCIECGKCTKVCPVLTRPAPPKHFIRNAKEPMVLAVQNKSKKILSISSSGGLFYSLAESIVKKQGVVFGSKWMYDFSGVKHVCIDKMEDIQELCSSKYMQSETGNSYIQAKRYLSKEKIVLYVGTPCQIAGLKAYLNNQTYDNLVTVELICHGVPHNILWNIYFQKLLSTIRHDFNKNNNRMKFISFRAKDASDGWSLYHFQAISSYGIIVDENFKENSYMKAFLNNLCLRESCYDCVFKGFRSGADLTMGDYWGIDQITKDFNNNGVSALCINTDRGLMLWKSVQNDFKIYQSSYADLRKKNPAIEKSAVRPARHNRFLMEIKQNSDFEAIVDKMTKKTLMKKIVINLKHSVYIPYSVIKKTFKQP